MINEIDNFNDLSNKYVEFVRINPSNQCSNNWQKKIWMYLSDEYSINLCNKYSNWWNECLKIFQIDTPKIYTKFHGHMF